jgi:hypothetical protein
MDEGVSPVNREVGDYTDQVVWSRLRTQGCSCFVPRSFLDLSPSLAFPFAAQKKSKNGKSGSTEKGTGSEVRNRHMEGDTEECQLIQPA